MHLVIKGAFMSLNIDELLSAGRLDEASRLISAALSANPNDVEALIGQARGLGAGGDLPAALASVEKALRGDSSHAMARGYRGILLYELNRQAEAQPELQAAIDAGLSDGALHFGLARCLAAGGELEAALTHTDAAILDQPKNWAFLFVRARLLSDLQRFDESIQALHATVEADPTQEEPWIVLCTVLINLGQVGDAVVNLQNALRHVPQTERIQELLAHAALTQGNVDLATHHLEELSRSNPQDATTMGNLALCYVAGGRAKMAESVYNNALKLAPKDAVLHYQLASLIEDQDGDEPLRRAVHHYQQAIAGDAQMWEPLSDLGRLHVTQSSLHDLDKAFALFDRAVAVGGERPEILMNMALGFAHSGDKAACIKKCNAVQAHAEADDALQDEAHALSKHMSS
jgi:tetratricopeptide (TPR) repeat protein